DVQSIRVFYKVREGGVCQIRQTGSAEKDFSLIKQLPVENSEDVVYYKELGHFGYSELPIPVYHPDHGSELKRILSLLCLKMKNRMV
ncbi:unnamed protein product, partial [Ilex paraguariensis]